MTARRPSKLVLEVRARPDWITYTLKLAGRVSQEPEVKAFNSRLDEICKSGRWNHPRRGVGISDVQVIEGESSTTIEFMVYRGSPKSTRPNRGAKELVGWLLGEGISLAKKEGEKRFHKILNGRTRQEVADEYRRANYARFLLESESHPRDPAQPLDEGERLLMDVAQGLI
jgi:hypothetical protein